MADRRRSPSNGVQKAVWASKIVFSLLGILSVVRLAVPPAAGVLVPALPRLWASLCPCLSPPYLFIVIHLIILVIWKLSDQKHHHGPPEATEAVKIKPFESAPPPPAAQAVPLSPRPTPPATPKPLDPDSDGNLLDKEAESSEENDSMEATWKAIMEKSPRGGGNPGPRRPPPPPSPPTAAIRARLPSVTGRDELNRRFDDFIKKRHDQIRLQRHESNQRRLQMMDSGFH